MQQFIVNTAGRFLKVFELNTHLHQYIMGHSSSKHHHNHHRNPPPPSPPLAPNSFPPSAAEQPTLAQISLSAERSPKLETQWSTVNSFFALLALFLIGAFLIYLMNRIFRCLISLRSKSSYDLLPTTLTPSYSTEIVQDSAESVHKRSLKAENCESESPRVGVKPTSVSPSYQTDLLDNRQYLNI
jgi:hypothetical protein